MLDEITDIMEYYNRQAENEDGRLGRHQLEFDLTWRYLRRYLQGKLLEIGAATGAYTIPLLKQGHSLTVVGPLYHLVHESNRTRAVREAFGRLGRGGLIFSAFISRHGVLGDLMQAIPGWIRNEREIRSLLAKGYDDAHESNGGFRGTFATIEEIRPLHEEAGFRSLALAATEPIISADDESCNRLDLICEVSRKEHLLESSRLLLYIGRKGNPAGRRRHSRRSPSRGRD